MALYAHGAARAESCGLVLADTKFEFGLTSDDQILLIDEVMTSDSSRYWPKDEYRPGRAQPSFDKQFRSRLFGADPLEQATACTIASG